MTADSEEQENNPAAMWTYIGVMVGFKLATLVVILIYTHELAVVLMLIALHIPWIIGALVMCGVPGTFWYRMLRARAKRAELIRQEFCDTRTGVAM